MVDPLGPFCSELVRQVRAQDAYGLCDGKPDAELLALFVIDKAKARAIPIIGNPDAKVLQRLNQFYTAMAFAIEKRCGIMATPLISISDEGFGRVVLMCGRLVVVSRTLRDVHRFGYASIEKLEEAGSALVVEAIRWIDRFHAAATAD